MSNSTNSYFTGVPQPDGADRNVASISKRSRSFRDVAEGIVVESNIALDYSIPLTRAERRRRDKATRKSPVNDRPIRLGSRRIKLNPGSSSQVHFDMKDILLTGPGLLVLTATPIKPHNGNIDRS
ncbi:MAG: hypothetical protein OXM01_08885 [Gemmatimonadota bacterium]|nr:hypothetical protein [Gemmatimonadota bacterium]